MAHFNTKSALIYLLHQMLSIQTPQSHMRNCNVQLHHYYFPNTTEKFSAYHTHTSQCDNSSSVTVATTQQAGNSLYIDLSCT